MEFTKVSVHQGLTLRENLNSMQLWSIPDALLVYLNCDNGSTYIASIAAMLLDRDHSEIIRELQTARYSSFSGRTIFRHVTTGRTANIIFKADSTLDDEQNIVVISKVTLIQWQDNDDAMLFFATLGMRKALGDIESKMVTRGGLTQVAFPLQRIELPTNMRSELEFFKCEVGVNVAYPSTSQPGHTTKRSVTVPKSLIHDDLPDLTSYAFWAYADFSPSKPIFLDASTALMKLVGRTSFKGDVAQVLREIMTSAGLERSMISILPALAKLDVGMSLCNDITFITMQGKETAQMTWYKTRSIIVGVWHYTVDDESQAA